ncbi:MAG: hypothetical protein U9Q40_08935 [Campylobacterota bacterium]|nr:hypothetical protein [Campylobacterota bacterium]
MILIPEVLAILILNFIFILLASVAFFLSLKIFLKWDINSNSTLQYTLEKQSYLTATIIKYIFIIKVPLFLFFIFTLDRISHILAGAMCGAGVVDATDYGNYLFVLKILNLYLFAYWLALHNEDIKHENQPYTKMKFGLFIVAFILFISELIVEGLMFGSIDLDEIVSCCGTIYSSSATSYISKIFAMSPSTLITLFYTNFLLIILFYLIKRSYLFAVANIVFIIISIVTLISFFGTYIYELPSHHCPFCFLQSDYYYVGYLLYILLYAGTFYGIVTGFIETDEAGKKENYKKSLLFNSLYVTLVTLYPILYYIKNGVWL